MRDPDAHLWRPLTDDRAHPLGRLNGRPLGHGYLTVRLGPANRIGADYFQVLLDARADTPPYLLVGLHHHGPLPSYCWVEVMQCAASPSQEEVLLAYLANLVPPGGHVMVEYDSDGRRETERALRAGVPPLLTPLGSSLFRAGLCGGFKDWSIAEGGCEGPRKLQAFKPLHTKYREAKAVEMAQAVAAFLSSRAEQVDAITLGRAREVAALLDLKEAPQVAEHLRRLVEQ